MFDHYIWKLSQGGRKRIRGGLLDSAGLLWIGIGPILYCILIGWPYLALLRFTVPLVGMRKDLAFPYWLHGDIVSIQVTLAIKAILNKDLS